MAGSRWMARPRATQDTHAVVSYGKYVTVWRRERGGAWKAIADIGNASPAPPNKEP